MAKLSLRLALAETREQAADDIQQIASALRSIDYRLGNYLVHDRNPIVRQKIAAAIAAIGPTATSAIPFVIKALDDPDEAVRLAAVRAVGGTAPASKAAIPKLIKLAQEKNVVMRRAAISVMRGFGAEAREAVPVLIAALDDPDPGDPRESPSVSYLAAIILGGIGSDAKSAADALIKLQHGDNVNLRGASLETLAKIVPRDPRVIPIFLDVLKNQDHKELRRGAARALGILGATAKEAVPGLIDALRAKDIGDQMLEVALKEACIWALGEIGPDAKAAIPILREMSTHLDPNIRSEVKNALEKIENPK